MLEFLSPFLLFHRRAPCQLRRSVAAPSPSPASSFECGLSRRRRSRRLAMPRQPNVCPGRARTPAPLVAASSLHNFGGRPRWARLPPPPPLPDGVAQGATVTVMGQYGVDSAWLSYTPLGGGGRTVVRPSCPSSCAPYRTRAGSAPPGHVSQGPPREVDRERASQEGGWLWQECPPRGSHPPSHTAPLAQRGL